MKKINYSLKFLFRVTVAVIVLALTTTAGATIPPEEVLNLEDSFVLTQKDSKGKNEAGDRFSEVVAVGDFNGDSLGDLAVGTPGENGGAGRVRIFLGAEEGLGEGTVILSKCKKTDQCGAALIAMDYNADGFEDLVVGAPGAKKNAGIIYVFEGSLKGLPVKPDFAITQEDVEGGVNEKGDRFGAALDAGDFNDDGYDDLTVGAPGEDEEAGVVFIFPTEDGEFLTTEDGEFLDGLVITQRDGGGAHEPGDRFGTALAVGDYTGEGFDELTVGAPGENNARGAVFVFYGNDDGITTGGHFFQKNAVSSQWNEKGDEFGAVLKAGDFSGNGIEDLAVGAPGENEDSGAVIILIGIEFEGLKMGSGIRINQSHAGGVNEPGDRFGAALAVGGFNDDDTEDLAVGAPGKANQAGAVFVFPAEEEVGITTGFGITQSDAGWSPEPGDRFGTALASEDFNDDNGAELAVGAPGEDKSSGAVFIIPGVALSPPAITQEHAGGVNQKNERFGSAEAVGDFNGDGFDDLAVGTPKDSQQRGAVSIFPGSEDGIAEGFIITQADFGEDNKLKDKFGSALVAGDFNDDKFDDLAVGTPGENQNKGSVTIFLGSEEGLVLEGISIAQSDAGVNKIDQARFGLALVAGHFNSDKYEDLAVGAPWHHKQGAVFIFPGSADGITKGTKLNYSNNKNVKNKLLRFGAALAAGDFNNDETDDLAVGAPLTDNLSGLVFVFPGIKGVGFTDGFIISQRDAGESDVRKDRFGSALAAGDFEGDGFMDLAVGAPWEAPLSDRRSGAVFIFPGSKAGITKGFAIDQTLTESPYIAGGEEYSEVNEKGDEFGAAITVADFEGDGISELIVGAPGEAPGPWPKCGMVFIFRGTEDGIKTDFEDLTEDEAVSDFNFFFTQSGFGGENEYSDRFGTSQVAGDFNGDGEQDLAVGAPGEGAGLAPKGSGAVYFIPGSELVL